MRIRRRKTPAPPRLEATYPNATTVVWWVVAPDDRIPLADRWFKLGAFDYDTRQPKEWPVTSPPRIRIEVNGSDDAATAIRTMGKALARASRKGLL